MPFPPTLNDNTSPITYKQVTLHEARKNPEYWKVVGPMYETQLSRLLQRAYQKKRKSVKKPTDKKVEYAETLVNPEILEGIANIKKANEFKLALINEPVGEAANMIAKQYQEQIQKGEWTKLNFSDPDFKRYMYKLLRLGNISSDQLTLALLLQSASEEFTTKIRQHSFNQAGPYDPQSIAYANKSNVQNFNIELKELNKNDNAYFTFDLPSSHLGALLYYCMEGEVLSSTWNKKNVEAITVALKHFIFKHASSENEKRILTAKIVKLANGDERTKDELQQFILKKDKSFSAYINKSESVSQKSIRDFESANVMARVISSGEQLPFLTLSPEYDPQDPNSPVLSQVVMAMPVLKTLISAMHGKEALTIPQPITGIISVENIRKLDEEKISKRPIEIVNDDFNFNQNPHNLSMHKFMLMAHDLYHCWRSSAMLCKPLIRHIRNLLDEKKGFKMSKLIWALTDLEIDDTASTVRMAKLTQFDFSAIAPVFLNTFGSDFFGAIGKKDDNCLILIDMIKNQNKWQEFLGCEPIKFLRKGDKSSVEVFQEMQKIINEKPANLNSADEDIYFILRFRLKGMEQKNINSILDTLIEHDLFSKIFKWNRNSGLIFQATKKTIESLKVEDFYNGLLTEIYKHLNEKNKLSLSAKLTAAETTEVAKAMSKVGLFAHKEEKKVDANSNIKVLKNSIS